MSASAVLRTILRHGPVARSTVARLAGISPAGVTRLTASLVELGLITETAVPVARNGMGRPHIPVDIDVERHTVAGVHIAHDHCTLAVLDLAGNVHAQQRIPHTSTDSSTLLTVIGDQLRTFLADYRPLALGVATGGWVDVDEGVMSVATVGIAAVSRRRCPTASGYSGPSTKGSSSAGPCGTWWNPAITGPGRCSGNGRD